MQGNICLIKDFQREIFRSSQRRWSMRKGVLKNSANFTGKHLCWSLFSIKLQAWIPATLLKKRLQHRCFPVKVAKFLRIPILKNICERLLVNIVKRYHYLYSLKTLQFIYQHLPYFSRNIWSVLFSEIKIFF